MGPGSLVPGHPSVCQAPPATAPTLPSLLEAVSGCVSPLHLVSTWLQVEGVELAYLDP